MSRATPDDQLKFLLSCVRHSYNGKIDFTEVAKECRVVSKGAAAKRYERLLKANGIHPSGGVIEKSSTTTTKQKSRAEIAKAADAKRRKIEGDDHLLKADEEDELPVWFKAETEDLAGIKSELDVEDQSSAWPSSATATQSSVVPRQLMPQPCAVHTTILPQHRFSHRCLGQRFTSTVPYSALSPAQGGTPQSQSSFVDSFSEPVLHAPSLLSNGYYSSVVEARPGSDFFKPPNYQGSSSASRISPIPDEDLKQSKDEVQLSPRTDDTPVNTSIAAGGAWPSHKESANDASPSILPNEIQDLPTRESLGSRIENSIVITD